VGSRPLIGVSTYRETASWGAWTFPAVLLPAGYATFVQRAGGLPMLLPPGAPDPVDAARETVAALDGLLVAGGADLDPALYGAEPGPHTGPLRPDRDRWESALLRAALDRDLPVLAVCRGMQLLNVLRGGTLVQHLPEAVGHDGHAREPGRMGRHAVRLAPGSLPERLLGAEAEVRTYHHQAVGALGTGIEAAGWAADGTVEAVVLTGRAFVLGVQWHPEAGDDPRLFEALVARARHRPAFRAPAP
jgi:putative glutamine amidotransferase